MCHKNAWVIGDIPKAGAHINLSKLMLKENGS